jgi:hypothetical protein
MVLLDYNAGNLELVSSLIKKHLTYDLLPKKWVVRNMSNHMFGHCHNAAGCLYKIFGHESMHMYRGLDDENIWHWWCIDKDNVLIDLTVSQYTNFNRTPPYAEGEKSSMLGFDYRKRVLRLCDRVMNDIESSNNYGPAFWRT